jgi:hypothetical protein
MIRQPKTTPTLDHVKHLGLARLFHRARRAFEGISLVVWENFPRSHRTSKAADRINAGFLELQHRLDSDYHRVTSDQQFQSEGHVYYMHPEKRAHEDLIDLIFSFDPTHALYRKPARAELILGLYSNAEVQHQCLLYSHHETGFIYYAIPPSAQGAQPIKAELPRFYLRLPANSIPPKRLAFYTPEIPHIQPTNSQHISPNP